jgi:hypothetical protein
MNLSEHFTLAEMTRSAAATRKGIPNIAPDAIVAKLRAVCEHILEPVRAHYGRPITVLSGYRAPAVNKAVGGAATSQHLKGEAADFLVSGVSNVEVCRWMQANMSYDQLIYEFGEAGWIHCSWREGVLRNQEISAVKRGGKTVYLPGIVA